MVVHHPQTEEEYNALKGQSGLVVIDFSAAWCGPCRRIAPVFEALSHKETTVTFVHVDIDELPIKDTQDVQGVPTFQFYKNGQKVHQFSGANDKSLREGVEQYK
eukprot:TRINITY_DN9324_c0_g1_i1.p1 TRINITY_DN9324_c0_g1~~TRINITY_DN9324_c0_g1_i1.p1  ORF type:complete len:104 (-),score=20.03 TRINITY_DN9324_c0_g1_i1:75-386(-)